MDGPVRLTKRLVDAASPPRGEEAWLWDSEVRGFFLRVYKSGRKSFALKYRAGRQQRIHTIGPFGAPWTVEMARDKARALLVQLANGEDPQAARAADRRAPSVGDLIDRYLLEGPVDKPNKRQSTWGADRSNLDRHVRPLIGKLRADAVTARQFSELQRSIAAGKTRADIRTKQRGRAIISGGAGTAARTMITLAAMYSWAVKRGIVPENPVKGVQRLKGEAKERFLSPEEFERLFIALGEVTQCGAIHPQHATIIKLLAFTGCRKSEILGLRWSEIDFERGAIALPGHRAKNGAKRVPLSSHAMGLLQALPRTGDHVFPPLRAGEAQHTVGIHKSWVKVRSAAGLPDVRLHDLRHSFASMAVGAGESLYVVQRALGHKKSVTTERYAHLRDDPVRALAERVGDMLGGNGGGTF